MNAKDSFLFLSTTSSFVIEFIFGGYTLEKGGSSTLSGFTGEPAGKNPGKTAIFKLFQDLGGPNFTLIDDETYMSDITEVVDNDGTSVIFSGGPGDYVFQVDGSCKDCKKGVTVGLYDVKISAVPLPASALLLVAGLFGLGAVARRRKAA